MACCTIATAFWATRSVIWRRSVKRFTCGSRPFFGMGPCVGKKKNATLGALFFLDLYFQNSILKRKLCHTLHKFIRPVCNHLIENRPPHPLDKNFSQARKEAGSV